MWELGYVVWLRKALRNWDKTPSEFINGLRVTIDTN